MNENVKTYDTYRSNKDGKRYRIIEVGNEIVKLVKLNDEGTRKHAGGRPRILTIADLFKGYSRVNLPPVTVSKIETQKPIEDKTEEVIVQTENEAQIEEQAVTEASEPKPNTLEDTFDEFREKNQSNVKSVTATVDGREIQLEVLKEECISLKEERDALRAECLDYAEDRDRLRGELADAKKTISKMQQAHEAEVADLKDRIMEAEAEANAARKRKDEILKERTEYADALDNDSVAFEEILSLAETIQLVSTSSAKLAKQIIGKTEGRI